MWIWTIPIQMIARRLPIEHELDALKTIFEFHYQFISFLTYKPSYFSHFYHDLIPPVFDIVAPNVHILIYHFINFNFLPSLSLSNFLLFFLSHSLFFSFCTHHATGAKMSDSGVLICSRRHKWLKLVFLCVYLCNAIKTFP